MANWFQGEFRLRIWIGATACLLVVAALSILFWQAERPVSAQEFLQRTTQAEAASLRAVGTPVLYRKIQVKRGGSNEAVTWESWHDAERKPARQRFAGAKESPKPTLLVAVETILQANQLDPQHPLSAAAFAAWRNRIQRQAEVVATNKDGLQLTTTVAAPHAVNAIIEAALTVRKSDWHVVALRLQVQGERALQSFELRETAYEIQPQRALADLATATPAIAGLPKTSPSPSPEAIAWPSTSASVIPVATATAALEIEVLERLNQVNALLGEQLNLTRTAEGKLRIEGIVETDVRKGELLRALQAFADNPAVSIDLSTVAEAQARQAQASQPRNVIIQDAQVTQATIPVEAELRNYFTARGFSGERLEQEIQQFSAQICSRSSRASSHAHALKQIAARFTPEQLQTLEQATRERWRALLQQHANGYQRELQQLRQQLQPIFPAAAMRNAMEGTVASAEELLRAINQLFQLAAANDPALCQSFSVSTEATTAAVKRAEFWRAISKAENLATQIANWQ